MMYFWVKWIHVLATSVWFGVNLMQTGDIRSALKLGPPHTEPMIGRVNRIHLVSLISAFVSILSGFAMILLIGGFEYIPGRIHAGLGLTLLLGAIEYFLVHRSWRTMVAAVRSGDDAGAAVLFKRYAMGIGIGHLLRTIIFITMVVQF